MLVDKVLESINKYNLIERGESVVVGVSGGPDSVCLLHVLHSLKKVFDINIYAVHINHGLRGQESDDDQKYVEDICNKLDVPLYVRSFDIKEISDQRGVSLEVAGREVRYEQFGIYAGMVGAGKIAVAHNKNDQAETVIMHIIRGTGLDGLKGMDFKRGMIIRPLLDIERKDIESYCRQYGLDPRTDSSNLESIYTRNKIRLDLIPAINRTFNTDIVASITRMSKLLTDDYNYIEYSLSNLYNRCVVKKEDNAVHLNIERLNGSYPGIRKRLIRQAIKDIKGNLKEIENVHIEDVLDLCVNGRTGAEIHLPCNMRVQKSYGLLIIFIIKKKVKNTAFEKKMNIPGETVLDGLFVESSIETVDGNFTEYINIPSDSLTQFFDYEQLEMGINIRSRRDGDIFRPYKSNGTKKLKEYFIDCKIPRYSRDAIPLITKNNEIVWVIGYKISDKFKVTENTKRVLKITYKKGTN